MLPKELQARLATEFRFAAEAIKASPDFATKVYFFSVFYGEPQRLVNQHWDATLAMLIDVVQSASNHMISKPILPPESSPLLQGVPIGWLEALDDVSERLTASFEAEELDYELLYTVLGRVAELGYILTGNGFYLFLRGQIKL